MALNHTSVNVITGATGSGKTTLVRALLGRRPARERWTVLMNDFGTSTLASPSDPHLEQVEVREVAGCICCSGQLVLRTALVSLVRESRPDRVLIEASAAAEPAALFEVLGAPGLASALHVDTVIATAAVSQLTETRYVSLALYREQIGAADVVVLTAPAAATVQERDAARVALGDIIAAGTRVIEDMREVGVELLDATRRPPPSQPSP
jgi:G3E family GTPase